MLEVLKILLYKLLKMVVLRFKQIKEEAFPSCGCGGGGYRCLREAEAEATEPMC